MKRSYYPTPEKFSILWRAKELGKSTTEVARYHNLEPKSIDDWEKNFSIQLQVGHSVDNFDPREFSQYLSDALNSVLNDGSHAPLNELETRLLEALTPPQIAEFSSRIAQLNAKAHRQN